MGAHELQPVPPALPTPNPPFYQTMSALMNYIRTVQDFGKCSGKARCVPREQRKSSKPDEKSPVLTAKEPASAAGKRGVRAYVIYIYIYVYICIYVSMYLSIYPSVAGAATNMGSPNPKP